MANLYYPIYIIYLYLIISLVFFDRKKPVQRLSWIVVVVFIPIIGLLFYLFIGRDTYLEYWKRRVFKRHGQTLKAIEQIGDGTHTVRTDLSKSQAFHLEYCRSSLTPGNKVQVFTDGSSKYRQLFGDLKEARDNIHVQYFTINNDEIGQELMSILTQKAQAGVEVKVLYDSIGCLGTFVLPLLRKLARAGGQVARIRPHALDLNYRNHRKIVVIDGKIGYTGGMNMGCEYKYGVDEKPWRDTHLRITGYAVHKLQQVFLTDWVVANRGGLHREIADYFPPPDELGDLDLQVVANGLYNRCRHDDIMNLSYFQLISGAKRRVWIQTPYFAPSEIVLQTLKTLASSGVDVRIMTSSVFASGALFHNAMTNYFLGFLVESGVRVFKYDGVIHAKTLLIDDDALCIGTVNLNARSLLRDDELYLYFESPEFVSKYRTTFQEDLGHCWEVDYAKLRRPHFTSRAMESITSLFSSLY